MKAIRLIIAFIALVVFLHSLLFGSSALASGAAVTPVSVDNSSPNIGDSFNLTATISDGVLGGNYYLKCRIGADSSSLTDGQTYNPISSNWLDDSGSNGAWSNMPQITVGSDGSWQGAVTCRIKSGSTSEGKIIFVSACLNTNDTCALSFQSLGSLNLSPINPSSTPAPTPTPTPAPTSTPTPAPTSTPTPAPTSTPTPAPTPNLSITPTAGATTATTDTSQKQVLGQSSNSLFSIPQDNGSSDKNLQLFSASDKQVISKILIFLGVIFMFLCGIVVFYPKIDNYLKSKKNEGSDIHNQ